MSGGAIVVVAPTIRAVFERTSDRWTHRVELVTESGATVVVMRSLEGLANEVWPPSPVIQHLEFQTQPDGISAAMGVGMSGKSHWSLSCSARPVSNARNAGPGSWWLQFDVACRTRERFERLGSTYEVEAECTARSLDEGVIFRGAGREWFTTSNASRICNENQTLRMDMFDNDDESPHTVQWSYFVNQVRRAGDA